MSQALENVFPKGLFLLSPPLVFLSFPASALPHLMTQGSFIAGVGWRLIEFRPLEKGMATTPVFLPREFHGQKSLVGHSPWGHKELDMSEMAEQQIINTINA